MAEASIGALVPYVKSDSDAPAPEEFSGAGNSICDGELDRDLLCPICMQIIRDAFLTACGHSFCYLCIVTHLRNKNDCPSCRCLLSTNLIFPNFALDKLLKKMSTRQFVRSASSSEHLRLALQQGCEVSVKDLDSLLSLLSEKRRRMEQEEAETNLEILSDFLVSLRKRRLDELNEVQNDLEYIKEDIKAVLKRKTELSNVINRFTVRLTGDNLVSRGVYPEEGRHAAADSVRQPGCTSNPLDRDGVVNPPSCSPGLLENDLIANSELRYLVPSGRFIARKRQIQAQFNELQECYLKKRRHWIKQPHAAEERMDRNNANSGGYHAGLEDFQSVLTAFTRYSRVRVISELRHGDGFRNANIISSIEFDRDSELFATAGVSRRIKVYDFSSVVDEPEQLHCAIVDIPSRFKLSCLSWNKYTKHYIASSDYDGIVTVWDVTTRQSVREYEEHEKRAWSVDFSHTEPSLLVSGGDDCKVKVWCTKQEESVLNINIPANICSVNCNPGSSLHVAVGSADHQVRYYDLRNVSQPLNVFSGHTKAVSYVKFLSTHELASASTDSTLCLWDVEENLPPQVYRGHTNEKNFVGLSVNSEYLSCGSETNEVVVYHKAVSTPVARYRFNTSGLDDTDEDQGLSFVSSVCWKSDSPVIMAANSQGMIKILALAP